MSRSIALWEYLVIDWSGRDDMHKLQELGNEGWELVGVAPGAAGGGGGVLFMFFKRPLP